MIHALPGLGADRRMYPDPWSTLPKFVAHDWPKHTGEGSLAKMARSVSEAATIQDGDILVGSSLGGMVACEIAKIREIPVVFLVGSAMRREEVRSLLAAVHPLARLAPFDWLRVLASKVPSEPAQMFAKAETSFMRAMCAAVFEWDGLGVSKTRVYRIHGRHDLIIPPPPEVDLLLDGGHLISMSHAQDCVEFIRATLRVRVTGSHPGGAEPGVCGGASG